MWGCAVIHLVIYRAERTHLDEAKQVQTGATLSPRRRGCSACCRHVWGFDRCYFLSHLFPTANRVQMWRKKPHTYFVHHILTYTAGVYEKHVTICRAGRRSVGLLSDAKNSIQLV